MDKKLFVRDGQEVFDEHQVKDIEANSAKEHEQQITKLLRDFGTKQWLKTKGEN